MQQNQLIILIVILAIVVIAIVAVVLLTQQPASPAGYPTGYPTTTGTGGVAPGQTGSGVIGTGDDQVQYTYETGAGGWCPVGGKWSGASSEGFGEVTIIGLEMRNGKQMCHGQVVSTTPEGTFTMDLWWDETGEDVQYSMSGVNM